ncbi:MAG: glycosyltransferase family 2 protein [Candidatus Doudnabacteria bacterium]|nr:glycosyltransferase family 2 protein [Candidatus Doudnabacteria bacterium]
MESASSKIDLSIIIVCYKSKGYLAVLLPSIFQSTKKYSLEVIVVDNDSRDGTVEAVGALLPAIPNLKLIKNINNGFSAGNNRGMKSSSGRYILLLNPDTKVQPDTFEVMLDMMENRPNVGVSGCKLIKGDGKLDLACRRRFPNPSNSFKRLFLLDRSDYNYTEVDENREMEVDSVVGAFLLIRRQVLDKIGPLDERFFMYGEDLDWCWRCKAAGYKVLYYPRTFIYHYKGQSSKKAPLKMLRTFHDAMWIFYVKHYAGGHRAAFNALVWCGIYGRYGALAILNFFKNDPRVSA